MSSLGRETWMPAFFGSRSHLRLDEPQFEKSFSTKHCSKKHGVRLQRFVDLNKHTLKAVRITKESEVYVPGKSLIHCKLRQDTTPSRLFGSTI